MSMNGNIPSSPKPNLPVIFVSIYALIVILLHSYASFYPSASNWGFHILAFFPLWFKILIPSLMLISIIPQVGAAADGWLNGITDRLVKISRPVWYGTLFIFCIGVLAVLWMGREQFFLLGDGTLLPRTLPLIKTQQQFVTYFHYEPLAGYFNWIFYQAMQSLMPDMTPVLAIQAINTFFGLACLMVLIPLSRALAGSSSDRVLIYLGVISSGGTILLFGYVENYTSVLFFVIIYYFISAQFIRQKLHLLFPSVLFGILVACHFGTLVLIPSYLYLLYLNYRRGQHAATWAMAAVSLMTFVMLMLLLGYHFDLLWERILGSHQHVLGITGTRSEFQAYPLISIRHLVDIINIHLLICPFAVIIIAIILFVLKGSYSKLTTSDAFLLICAFCGIIFTMVFNFDFGMARDWDLLVPFHLGLLLASLSLLLKIENIKTRHYLFVVTISISLLHTLAWLLITSDAERGIARYSVLADPQIWGKKTLTAAFEEEAIYYRDKGDYINSVEYYKKFLSIDSTNIRALHNYVSTAKLTGDRKTEITALEQAARAGLRDPADLKRLAALYLQNGENEKAGETCEALLSLEPRSIEMLNTVGMYYRDFRKDGARALQYFQRAINTDSTQALAYLNSGLVYRSMENNRLAKYFLGQYLRLDPSGKYAPLARKILEDMH
jgi:tetratricopeptide (TPR) repeat protein